MIDLFEMVRRFSQAEIQFVIVGGIAIRGHGGNYVTEDLDICYSRTNENLKTIASVLAPINPRPRNFPEGLPYVFDWTTLQHVTNFTFETSMGDIDLLEEVKGVGSYDDLVAQSLRVDFEGYSAYLLSIPALIKAKKAAGRPKDEAELKVLEALYEAGKDET